MRDYLELGIMSALVVAFAYGALAWLVWDGHAPHGVESVFVGIAGAAFFGSMLAMWVYERKR